MTATEVMENFFEWASTRMLPLWPWDHPFCPSPRSGGVVLLGASWYRSVPLIIDHEFAGHRGRIRARDEFEWNRQQTVRYDDPNQLANRALHQIETGPQPMPEAFDPRPPPQRVDRNASWDDFLKRSANIIEQCSK
jgi:hypothetical protein